MLRVRRSFQAPEVGFSVESHLAVAVDHRIVATCLTPNTVVRASLLPREPDQQRRYVVFLLGGEVWLPREQKVIVPPALLVAASRSQLLVDAQATYLHGGETLVLEVEAGEPPEVRACALDANGLATARALHDAMAEAAPFEVFAERHRRVFELLRHRGIVACPRPIAPPRPFDDEFAEMLTSVLALRHERPALVDFPAFGALSTRTARRRYHEAAERYGLRYATWQAFRRQWSLALGCLLLTVPGTHPAAIARWVGFTSPTSLHHGLSRAGLPAPLELQRRASALRATGEAALARLR